MRKEDESKLSKVKLQYIENNLHGENLLDTGSGYCYYSEWLSEKYPNLKITSVDKLSLINHKGIKFLCLDLENPIPLEDNIFDTIIAFDIIEHLNNAKLFVKELYRICQPNGILIGSVPSSNDKFLPAYNLTFRNRKDLDHKQYFQPSSLENLLKDGGFSVTAIDLQGIVSPHVFAEFFPYRMQFFVKKTISLLHLLRIINYKKLSSDLFFVAKKLI